MKLIKTSNKYEIFDKDKLIASSDNGKFPNINFENLSDEDYKKIEWVNVEKLARNFIAQYPLTERMFSTMLSGNYTNTQESDGYSLFIKCLTEFHKAAQSLSEKKFSEEDMKSFAIYCADNHLLDDSDKTNITWEPIFKDGKKLTMSQMFENWRSSQPKVFDVEVEMKTKCYCGHTDWCDCSENQGSPFIQQPKITNNSIKILKVL